MKAIVKIRRIAPALIALTCLIPAERAVAQTLTTLYSFDGNPGRPQAGLLLSGNTLYGTAYGGNSGQPGSVFAINTDGTGFTNVYRFTPLADPFGGPNNDGGFPLAGLTLSGNTLYGTAAHGGTWGEGTIFAVNTNGTGFTNLHNFSYAPDNGASPQAGLILSGNVLYGTAFGGGSADAGTVFAIQTDGTGYTNLGSFTGGVGGGFPVAGLTLSGNTLYGTTHGGDNSDPGTVFAISIDGTGFTTLQNLAGGKDGASPLGGLVLSGATLYGTTGSGGDSGAGTVFAVNTDGKAYTTLYSFPGGKNGANPWAGLALSGTVLYGTTFGGGADSGTVFALNTDGTGFKTLYSFTGGYDGAHPWAGLILSGGTLYGTTSQGGGSGTGTVFALALPRQPILTDARVSGTDMVLTAANGLSGGTYTTLASTNPALPLTQWTPVTTNVLSASGVFTITVTNSVASTIQQRFYILTTQ